MVRGLRRKRRSPVITYNSLACGSSESLAAQQLRASLVSRSVAVVRLPKARMMRFLYAEAEHFFKRPAVEKNRYRRNVWRASLGPRPVCIGWRQVGEVKELIRCFTNESAPLPTRSFRTAALVCEKRLQALLNACLRCVVEEGGASRLTAGDTEQLHQGNCALDLFWYRNNCEDRPNCAAHIDRGLLHALVVSPAAGLELWDVKRGCFCSAEQLLGRPLLPLRDVLVIPNFELQELSHAHLWRAPTRAYSACVHRVGKPGAPSRPRLSISFEVRSAGGVDVDKWYAGIAFVPPQ
eukprot:CAMPEP_0183358738 /NCGR_PEP_ID=MMETSP0164_2-20130417/50094_1 /TAXON_ID=221442 /ORGANISM="Coccolithus pelagicus ssp braarudi, Strain PLY182g" /LENGTH=293 /DNA_ID=CAMNT_0025532681 /DNA_START=24 /DNA_END=905 /DNA_ORIENTATION=+